MADFYHDKWNDASSIEGASQRVQEDTLKFARIMEGLGVELLRSLMTLIASLRFYGVYLKYNCTSLDRRS